jgi:type IV pilus assembly protein PilM
VLFSKPSKAIGVDIGSHSVKAVLMSKAGGRLRVDRVGHAVLDRNQMNVEPVLAQATAMQEAVAGFPVGTSLVAAALPGQNVVIRHPRHSDGSESELARAIQAEAAQNLPYELAEVNLDWAPLEKVTEGDATYVRVVLVAARHEVIDSRAAAMEAAGLQCGLLGVDSLALADAAEGCDFLRVGESVALINLGATNTNIHFTKDGISNFIRDVSWGGKELIQAVAKAKRCDFVEAERELMHWDGDADVSGSVDDTAGASADAESGPSLLDPLEDEVGGLGELDDMGEADVPAQQSAAAPSSESLGDIMKGPLARLVGEIRRSFDFYEQQLYEKSVDRIILSGGVAHLGPLVTMLRDELGVGDIQVADPSSSALAMGGSGEIAALLEHPPQFVVAVGLAARGMAEL